MESKDLVTETEFYNHYVNLNFENVKKSMEIPAFKSIFYETCVDFVKLINDYKDYFEILQMLKSADMHKDVWDKTLLNLKKLKFLYWKNDFNEVLEMMMLNLCFVNEYQNTSWPQESYVYKKESEGYIENTDFIKEFTEKSLENENEMNRIILAKVENIIG